MPTYILMRERKAFDLGGLEWIREEFRKRDNNQDTF